ncbi:MAG TPA: prepilin-type N-terminal cleavage/methylation domain-containing protein [Nitrospiraceae bacterium]|jgi:general secretion pathway protein I|nr:prepilin-type N-terminal cleavage/methylation domain-containing protein [Nitrospiraceae bacterium]
MGNERGFTLLEVVIALGILALALPILLGLRNWDLDLHARAKEMTAATILAQEKLIETELGTLLPLGETGGEFLPTPLGSQPTTVVTNRQSNYRWKRIVSSTPLPIVREVKIQVLWPRGTIDEMLEVSTYVFSTTPTP